MALLCLGWREALLEGLDRDHRIGASMQATGSRAQGIQLAGEREQGAW